MLPSRTLTAIHAVRYFLRSVPSRPTLSFKGSQQTVQSFPLSSAREGGARLGPPTLDSKSRTRRLNSRVLTQNGDYKSNKWARPQNISGKSGGGIRDQNRQQEFQEMHPEKLNMQEHKHTLLDKWQKHEKDKRKSLSTGYANKSRTAGRRKEGAEEGFGRVDSDQLGKVKRRKKPVIMKDILVPEAINVANLARIMGVRLADLEHKMRKLGMENPSHDYVLTADDASLICLEYNLNPIVQTESNTFDLHPRPPPSDPSSLPLRPPVVTIMGHVDHGKTTLLDTLRKSSVAASEAGGITQHIGAFSVELPSRKRITFLDTPGHAAFSNMRARGAHVTDIVVLVVAADDGVMPQTAEAIRHANEAGVPIIVAINKCDKHDANPQKAKESLLSHGVQLEEFGGDVQAVEVSGLTGKGLDQLEEAIVTLAELLELRAEADGASEGVVIESQQEKGRGNVATLLIRRGSLRTGDVVVAGNTWCRVRSMIDDRGKVIKIAAPGTPVKVIGWRDLPAAGDTMLQAESEDVAKRVVEIREARRARDLQIKDLEAINEKRRKAREEAIRSKAGGEQLRVNERVETKDVSESNELANETDLERQETEVKELRAIVKGDVSGTVEAVVDSLAGLQNKEVRVKVVSSGVGDITEGDVQLATACDGLIIGFNVKADKRTQQEARQQKVTIKSYSVIYKLLDDVKLALGALLPPTITTQVTGEATVLQIFQVSAKGKEQHAVAGCRVTNGAVSRTNSVRVLRDQAVIWEGELSALKHHKKDVSEARKGTECGLSFEGFSGFREGDVIQSLLTVETPRTF
ncbi:uncharacterized protein VTP21DRAFT_11332 [Calcarisporiella thermophila]|uniref:uncharacterized protein n=1 Tax=Calcarisporiella thermophila TaxID=911321 RepID=UPI003743DD48